MSLSKEIPFQPNMDLGVGFDDLKGETRGILFEHSTILPSKGLVGQGQRGSFFMKRVDEMESLISSLNISIEASGRYGLFGADAQMDFMETSNFNSQSTFLIAKVQIEKSQVQFFEATIKETAKELCRANNKERFRELFGDFYVQGLTEGGEFLAVVEIIGLCKEDETKIATALEASYGTPISGIDLKASVDTDAIKRMSKKEINICINQIGGAGEKMVFQNDIDKIIEMAKNFSLAITGNSGVNYRAHLKSYKTLDQLPEANKVEIQAKEDCLNDCARKRIKYMTLLNDLEFYDNNATLFDPAVIITDDNLSKFKIEITELQNLLTKHAIRVADDFSFNEYFVEKISDIPVNLSEINLPKRIEHASTSNEIIIPNLCTLTLDEAIREIAREKLALAVSYHLTEVASSTTPIVKTTVPAAGSKAKPGDQLGIYYEGPKEKWFRNKLIVRKEIAQLFPR